MKLHIHTCTFFLFGGSFASPSSMTCSRKALSHLKVIICLMLPSSLGVQVMGSRMRSPPSTSQLCSGTQNPLSSGNLSRQTS